jgi:Co/Zn/Cd efflux system component
MGTRRARGAMAHRALRGDLVRLQSAMTLSSGREERRYLITIRGIAIGIFLVAAGEVAYAIAIRSAFLVKDGFDWIYDVLLYGMAAIIFGRGARAERIAALAGAAIMFVSINETIYDMVMKIVAPRQIEPVLLGVSALSTIVVVLLQRATMRFSRQCMRSSNLRRGRRRCADPNLHSTLSRFCSRCSDLRDHPRCACGR